MRVPNVFEPVVAKQLPLPVAGLTTRLGGVAGVVHGYRRLQETATASDIQWFTVA